MTSTNDIWEGMDGDGVNRRFMPLHGAPQPAEGPPSPFVHYRLRPGGRRELVMRQKPNEKTQQERPLASSVVQTSPSIIRNSRSETAVTMGPPEFPPPRGNPALSGREPSAGIRRLKPGGITERSSSSRKCSAPPLRRAGLGPFWEAGGHIRYTARGSTTRIFSRGP